MILNAKQILSHCTGPHVMISPHETEQKRMGSLSYGPGYFGYDIRISGDVFMPTHTLYPVSPAHEDPTKTGIEHIQYDRQPLDGFVLKPGALVFASTLEYFNIPSYLVAMVLDKSTLARLGVAVQNTIVEPGWSGYLTVEITNHGPLDIHLRSGMPIAQMVFMQGDALPNKASYSGRYQNQPTGTPALPYS